ELLDAVGNLLPDCDGVYLNLCQNQDCDEAEYFEITAGTNVPEKYQHLIGQRIFMSAFPMSETASQEKLVVIEDTHSDERVDEVSRASWDAFRTRAALAVQFYRDKQRFGWLFFNYVQPRQFNEHDRRLALGIGDLVMAAVERIRLLQETAAAVEAQRQALLAEQEAHEDLSLLYQASEAVNAATTLADVIKALAPLAYQIEKVNLILWEHLDYRKASYFEVVAGIDHNGNTPAAVGNCYKETDFPISQHMAKLRQLAIENIDNHPLVDDLTRENWRVDNIYSLLLVSLVQDERWYGVLSFESTTPRRYSERDRRLTLAISDLVLSAVIRIQAQHELAQAAEAQRSAFLSEQESREEMVLLYQVSKRVNQASSLSDVGEAFLQLFERPLHATIWAWEHFDRSRASYVEVLATTDSALPVGTRLSADDVPEAMAIEPGQLIPIDDVEDPQWANDPTTASAARRHGFRSFTFSNLAQGGRVLGLFTTGSWTQHTYTPREKRLIAAVIDLTAAALERFRLRAETEKARFRAEILANLHAELTRATREVEILMPIVGYASDYGAYHVGLNYATNEDDDPVLASDVVVSWDEGTIINYQQRETQPRRLNQYGLAKLWMPHPEQVFYMENVATDERLSEAERENILRDFRTRALIILPLFSGGLFQGLVSISWTQPHVFSEEERYIFEQLIQAIPSVIATRRALLAEQKVRAETALLYQVSKTINRATTMPEVLAAVKHLFLDPIHVAIFAWEHYDRSRATYLESIAATDPNVKTGVQLPREIVSGPAMLDPNQMVVANDVDSPEWVNNPAADSARLFGLHSIAYTNLMHGKQVIGLLAIASYAPYHFNPQEIRLMSAIAELTSAALERFRARQAEEEARHEREELFQASQAINAASTFQEILKAVSHIAFDNGDFYLYIFENFDFRRASYIETVATGESRFMTEGMRIPFEQLPFLREHPTPGLAAYEDIANHPDLDPVTKATMLEHGTQSNLRFGLSWHNRLLGAFGIDHDTPRQYSESEKRMMNALGELISAAVERIRLQQETQAAKEKAERLAAQAQQLAALEERTRLARELHDSVSQALYGIGLGAQTAQRFLDKDPALVRESVEYVLALAEAGLAEMRALIFELRPESLENEGLIVALTKQCASLQARHGITVQLDLCDEPPLVLTAKESLYRVAREALHNIVKHASASEIKLRVCCQGDQLCLEVIDNGIGFETSQDFPGHLGLQSMQERVAQLGGTLSITSTLRQGTALTVIMPLKM
ncbi:MAG: GAF domain-containing protein, partial [Anaerolineae bacterium]|nr:GAF domain-containing protein [Anaerolineae bacterium]